LNREDAEDVISESVAKALQALHTLKDPKYLGTWFYRIVINTAITMQNKKAKVIAFDPHSVEWQILTQSLIVEDSHEGIHFVDLIASLNSDQRILLILRYFEELPIAEIAEILGENVNTLKTRLYRTLRILRAEMEENHGR
jgi:RNA polymerase sigma-70 factor, ECF subfamily